MKNKLKALGALLVFLGGVCEVEAVDHKPTNPAKKIVEMGKPKNPKLTTPGKRIDVYETTVGTEEELRALLNKDEYSSFSPENKEDIVRRNKDHWQAEENLLKTYETTVQTEDYQQAHRERSQKVKNDPLFEQETKPGPSIIASTDHVLSSNKLMFNSNTKSNTQAPQRDSNGITKINPDEVDKFKKRSKSRYKVSPLGKRAIYIPALFEGSLAVTTPMMAKKGEEAKKGIMVDLVIPGNLDKFNNICDRIIRLDNEQNDLIFNDIEALVFDHPDVIAARGQDNYREVVVNVFRESVLLETAGYVETVEENRRNQASSPEARKRELEAMRKPKGLSLKEKLKLLNGGH